jgi:hypothetical protein
LIRFEKNNEIREGYKTFDEVLDDIEKTMHKLEIEKCDYIIED